MNKFKLLTSVAFKYLFAKKSFAIINIISAISVVGVAVGTMALFVVLSVFNGFESIILDLSNNFHSDFKIEAKTGKTFDINEFPLEKISQKPEVAHLCEVIEDMALARYNELQHVVHVKAVSSNFLIASKINDILIKGEAIVKDENYNYIIVGAGVDYALGINLNDYTKFISLYVPRRTARASASMQHAFVSESVLPVASFSVQQEFDEAFVLIDIDVARKLYEYDYERTSVEIFLNDASKSKRFEKELIAILGDDFVVKNRYKQQEFIYKILKSEKLAIFLILSFILIIATFNVIGTLSMIILEKRKDIAILNALGFTIKSLKQIFIYQGMIIIATGAVVGLFFGFIIAYLQQNFGLIRLGPDDNSFITQYYPVLIKPYDILIILGTVLVIGFIASLIPSKRINSEFSRLRDIQPE